MPQGTVQKTLLGTEALDRFLPSKSTLAGPRSRRPETGFGEITVREDTGCDTTGPIMALSGDWKGRRSTSRWRLVHTTNGCALSTK